MSSAQYSASFILINNWSFTVDVAVAVEAGNHASYVGTITPQQLSVGEMLGPYKFSYDTNQDQLWTVQVKQASGHTAQKEFGRKQHQMNLSANDHNRVVVLSLQNYGGKPSDSYNVVKAMLPSEFTSFNLNYQSAASLSFLSSSGSQSVDLVDKP